LLDIKEVICKDAKNKIYETITMKKKFDIRLWVLVTSFSPLKAFLFSKCYLRLCG